MRSVWSECNKWYCRAVTMMNWCTEMYERSMPTICRQREIKYVLWSSLLFLKRANRWASFVEMRNRRKPTVCRNTAENTNNTFEHTTRFSSFHQTMTSALNKPNGGNTVVTWLGWLNTEPLIIVKIMQHMVYIQTTTRFFECVNRVPMYLCKLVAGNEAMSIEVMWHMC